MPYLVQPRDRIVIKDYGLLYFAKNMVSYAPKSF